MDIEQFKTFVRRRWVSIAVIGGGIALLVVIGIVNNMRGGTGKVKAPTKQWEAESIAQDYLSDPSQADRDFKGKVVGIKGVVVQTGNDDGLPYVALKHTSLNKSNKTGVLCYFATADKSAVDKLKPGMQTRLYGICIGKAPSGASAAATNMVLVKDCRFY